MSNNNFELKTPVLFLVFNRLDTTKQVFEAIRQAQSPRFYAVDVFVAPSVEDNLPNTVMESLACGTPTVAFKIKETSILR
ncbi:glycosyltransferase [Geminocystis sp. CENA526]|uniref:glycosyltransferase n=1 Tax=Geminocystis sp. CENA526 TaxID=1355871 RepID=UPI003D6F15C2